MPDVGGPSVQAIPRSVTLQPGSTPSAPVATDISLGDVWCYSVEVEVPKGTALLMGFALTYANTQIIPWSQTPSFITVDDYEHTFPIDAELGKGLALVGYNAGAWPHTVYMRFLAVPVASRAASAAAAPMPALDLSALGKG